MTLNQDLFGKYIPEKPSAAPVSVQKNNKVRVFHASWEQQPPHSLAHESSHTYEDDDNIHPDIIHAGTPQSVPHRTYIHEYEIDLGQPSTSPVVWGDSPRVLEQDTKAEERLKQYSTPDVYIPRVVGFNKKMRGVQEGLFENTPADVMSAVSGGTVMPYRNRREDAGSISFMIPKSAVGGAVRYIGVHEGKEFRDSLNPSRPAAETEKQEKAIENWKGLY